MKIYLIYAGNLKKDDDVVMTAFTEEETAKNYCDYWNEHLKGKVYFYTETDLDKYAEIYKNKF